MGRGSESNACQARSTPRDVARMMTQIQKEICKLKTIKETRKRCSNRSRRNHTLSGGCLHKYPIQPSSSLSSTSCAAFIMQPAPSHPLGLNRFFSYFNDASFVPCNHPKECYDGCHSVIHSFVHSVSESVGEQKPAPAAAAEAEAAHSPSYRVLCPLSCASFATCALSNKR